MRKLLFCNVMVILLLLTFSVTVNAAPVEPVRTMEIASVCPGPEIDGIEEELYGETQTTSLFNPTGHVGDADFMTEFSVCWNLEYFFLHARITDDVKHCYQWGVGNPWEFDNIEIFLQMDTCTAPNSYNETTIQLRICRGLDSVENPGYAKRSDFLYYMDADVAGGWITEVAVPWQAVLPSGMINEELADYLKSRIIGFDFAGADSDNSDGDESVGNRDVQTAWDMDDPSDNDDRTEDLAWNNTSVFGYASLNRHWCWGGIESPFQTENASPVFPNPASSSIRIKDIQVYSQIMICDLQGNIVLQTGYHPGQELDVSFLCSGLYRVVINGQNNGRFVKP